MIGTSKAQQASPDQYSHPVFNALPSGEPAQDVSHIDRDVVKFMYVDNKAGCRAQIAIQAAYSSSREASIKAAIVVKPGGNETLDESLQ